MDTQINTVRSLTAHELEQVAGGLSLGPDVSPSPAWLVALTPPPPPFGGAIRINPLGGSFSGSSGGQLRHALKLIRSF